MKTKQLWVPENKIYDCPGDCINENPDDASTMVCHSAIEFDLRIKQREIERLEAELIKLSADNMNLKYMITAATGKIWTKD